MILAFYKGTRAENPGAHWTDRAICWWTDSHYSHVELVEHLHPDGHALTWSSSKRTDGPSGVRRAYINLSSGRWELVELPYIDRQAALDWFTKHQGLPYDYPGMLSHAVPLLRPQDDAWYCSRAVASALVAGGAQVETHITPGELYAWAKGQTA